MAFNAGKYALQHWRIYRTQLDMVRRPDNAAEAEKRRCEFLAHVRKYAPHWEQEALDIDRQFGVAPGSSMDALCFGCPVPQTDHECTSWIVMPEFTGGKQLHLHKNRDANSRHLTILQVASPGKHAWTGMGNTGSFTPTMGVNDSGLAIAMNSGEKTAVKNEGGFTTPALARILLEECQTAKEALALLETMIADKAYRHGDRGSIWFIADAKGAFIAEHNAAAFAAHPVDGIGVRANFWHYPEMRAHSQEDAAERLRQRSRENTAYKILLDECFLTHQVITAADHRRVSRSGAAAGDARALCSYTTNSASLFSIDCEYPGELTTAWLACGPPRRAVYIPIPVTAGEMPPELLNGELADAFFANAREYTGRDPAPLQTRDVPIDELEKLEELLEKQHALAVENARSLLHDGRKKEAAALLNEAFLRNWKLVKAFALPEK